MASPETPNAETFESEAPELLNAIARARKRVEGTAGLVDGTLDRFRERIDRLLRESEVDNWRQVRIFNRDVDALAADLGKAAKEKRLSPRLVAGRGRGRGDLQRSRRRVQCRRDGGLPGLLVPEPGRPGDPSPARGVARHRHRGSGPTSRVRSGAAPATPEQRESPGGGFPDPVLLWTPGTAGLFGREADPRVRGRAAHPRLARCRMGLAEGDSGRRTSVAANPMERGRDDAEPE